MKKVKYLFITFALGLILTSCGDSFLNQHPEGGLLLEDQYNSLNDRLEGAVRGIYSKMYEYGNHDTFGQRSIDMYGDLQSGDMAMKKSRYGWFEVYERGLLYNYASGYIWSYYYEILNLTNRCAIALQDNSAEIIAQMGGTPSDEIAALGYMYGQVLTMRGWAYAALLRYYVNPMSTISDFNATPAIPIYTEIEVAKGTLGESRSSVADVYNRIYEDLSMAIDLLDFYGKLNPRNSKLEVDADVARITLAYAMLNYENMDIIADGKNSYEIAFEQAKAAIDNGKYTLLKNAELTTTGFADVNAANWIWGQDVTVETTTALGSFFGQVDIHTYSYAAAGDTKGIDSNLYDEIVATGWDARVNWFRSGDVKFAYCPDGKFYCPKTKTETALDKVDRDWLCDNVFMRIEVAYLIAAEAAWKLGDETTARSYLEALCSERVLDGKASDMSAWIASTDVETALIYNWRVEMWGEGYGLQTLRRLSKEVTLGKNHLSRANQKASSIGAGGDMFQCGIPESEIRYNPNMSSSTTPQNVLVKKTNNQ